MALESRQWQSHRNCHRVLGHPLGVLTRPPGIPKLLKHDTVHHIRTSPSHPLLCRPRRLAPGKYKIAKDEFDQMLQAGVCRPSESPWSSPLDLARKGEAGW